MSCRARPAALEKLRMVFKTMKVYTPVKNRYRKPWHELIQEKTGIDPRVFNQCKTGIMKTIAFSEPVRKEICENVTLIVISWRIHNDRCSRKNNLSLCKITGELTAPVK